MSNTKEILSAIGIAEVARAEDTLLKVKEIAKNSRDIAASCEKINIILDRMIERAEALADFWRAENDKKNSY